MKRIFTSVGALGIGILGMCNLDAQEAKPWSLTAKLRGFYDDNYGTLPSANASKAGSYGFEVNPIGTFQAQEGPTEYQLEYDYRLRFYQGRPDNKTDNQHKVSLNLNSQFSDNWTLEVQELFAFAQEPGVGEQTFTTIVKGQSSYIRNKTSFRLIGQLTDLYDAKLSYVNRVVDYQADGDGSQSALLDKLAHTFRLESSMLLRDETTVLLGYALELTDFTSKDAIATGVLGRASGSTEILPEERDSILHAAYLGIDHSFTDVLSGHADLGVQFGTYPNAVVGANDDFVNPRVNAKLTYAFSDDGKADLGIKHGRTTTDVAYNPAGASTNPTFSMETTTVFGSMEKVLFGPLSGRLVFQIQDGTFDGGEADGKKEQIYTAGLTFTYEIVKGLAAETGYSLDRLDSDLPGRSFARHRGFIGLNYSY